MMTEQHYLLLAGSALVMIGLAIIIFSIKPRQNGFRGIILCGPTSMVWAGKNKFVLLIPLLFIALLIALVFLI